MTLDRAETMIAELEQYYSKPGAYPKYLKQVMIAFLMKRVPDNLVGQVLSSIFTTQERKYNYLPDIVAVKTALKELHQPYPEFKALPGPDNWEESHVEIMGSFQKLKAKIHKQKEKLNGSSDYNTVG